jgi:hypothetical protein
MCTVVFNTVNVIEILNFKEKITNFLMGISSWNPSISSLVAIPLCIWCNTSQLTEGYVVVSVG